MNTFDPNAQAGSDSGIFGLPFSAEESKLIYLPVPWEVTTSYGGGTSLAPSAILAASHQIDLFDIDLKNFWQVGLHMLPESEDIKELNKAAKQHAQRVIRANEIISKNSKQALEFVNNSSEILNNYVKAESLKYLELNKILAIVGGDHSVPYGALQAVAQKFPEFGILHFDAHSDTRCAYEGFTWSHASIMYNVLEHISAVKKIIQVGIRDFCEEEFNYIQKAQGDRVDVYYDNHLKNKKMQGASWDELVKPMIAALPEYVWISFDIDGLDPQFCPNTGTPVPGGLSFSEAVYIVEMLARSGRKIIGFDLNEVAPDSFANNEWDANVGARLLYKLSGWTLFSRE